MFQLLVLPTVRGLKVQRELGWDRTWTADPYESKEYSITYGETLNNKTGGAGQDEGCYCSGTSSVMHQSVGSEKLLLLILFYFLLPFLCPCPLHPSVLELFHFLPIILCARGVNEWSLVFSSLCWVKLQHPPSDNPWYFLFTENFCAFNRSKLHHAHAHCIISYWDLLKKLHATTYLSSHFHLPSLFN